HRPAWSSFFPYTTLFRSKVNAVLRAMTSEPLMRDKSVVRLSVRPSTKCSCAGSPPKFVNGKTTTDNRGAETGVEACRTGLSLGLDRKSTRLNSSHLVISY